MTHHPGRSVLEFGARGDGISDDGEALQRALNAGSGTVVVPAGHYLIGRVLRLGSGTRLQLDPQARMRLADGVATTPDDYFLTNANPTTGDVDIVIEGGFWDGNNTGNARPSGLFDYGCSGAMMHFQNVRGLRLADMELHNAEAYHVRLTQVRGFEVERIRFSATRVRNNNDGIHLGGNCEDGVIRDIKGLHPGVTGDDMIALNADDALARTEVKGMTCGLIRNIRIEEIEAQGCHSFVRLLSVVSPIENVSIRGVRGTCEIAAINCDAARGCRVPVFDEKNPPFPDGVGFLRNITAEDFFVAKSVANDIALLRLETRMTNFRVLNFIRDLATDLAPAVPTLRLRHVAVDKLLVNGSPGPVPSVAFGETHAMTESGFQELRIN
ncbi:MAG: endopolygalacturonase [Rariglobus sp.]|jgi:polygalacturonase|nr:endopolygalacturonase [Rariglobus sp.]